MGLILCGIFCPFVIKNAYECHYLPAEAELEADPAQTGPVVVDATGLANAVFINASNAIVNGLTLENANDAGLLAVGQGALTNLLIENNTVQNNAQVKPPANIGDWEALHVMGVQHSVIVNNVVKDNGDGGLCLTDETTANEYNVVEGNIVEDNAVDCGITLAGHVAGHGILYDTIVDNTSEGNAAAGVLMATAVPGDSVSNNLVEGNTISGNGDGGVTVHTHAPGSTVANNVIVDNTIGTNGNPDLVQNVGVILLASGSPITGTMIANNSISDDYYGIFESPWLTPGTEVMGNTFSHNIYNDPSWVTYSVFVNPMGELYGLLRSPNWANA